MACTLCLVSKAGAQPCTPSYTTGCTWGDDIAEFVLVGDVAPGINNPNTACPSGGYEDFTSMSASLTAGNTYSGNVTTSYGSPFEDVRIWIDYNGNDTFESSEEIATLASLSSSSTGSFTFTVPMAALGGSYTMRVRLVYNTTPATIDPCISYTYGECHDYTVHIVPASEDNLSVDSLLVPSSSMFCSDQPQDIQVRVRNNGGNTVSSFEVHWTVNGQVQTPFIYSGTALASASYPTTNFTDVVIGSYDFPFNQAQNIKAWTYMPNNVADEVPDDDTLATTITSAKQGVKVEVSPRDTLICAGGSMTLDAGMQPEGSIYVWNNGSMERSLTVSSGGSYHVRVVSPTGCQSTDTVFIEEHPDPTANSIAIIDEGGGTFTFNVIGANYVESFTWDFGDGSYPETGPGPKTHSYAAPGTYTATLTLSNVCTDIVITRLMEVSPVGISARDPLANQIRVYPNPAGSEVRISLEAQLDGQLVRVVNLMGQVVHEVAVGGRKTIDLSLGHLAPGTYQLLITTRQGETAKRLQLIR